MIMVCTEWWHLETDVILLAPRLLVRVVAAEDEAVAGEGCLLGGGHDGIVHIRLTWVTLLRLGPGETNKEIISNTDLN